MASYFLDGSVLVLDTSCIQISKHFFSISFPLFTLWTYRLRWSRRPTLSIVDTLSPISLHGLYLECQNAR